MQLTSENYYSQEANKEYMSVSGYKDFAGTYGKMPCEFYGMEKLKQRTETMYIKHGKTFLGESTPFLDYLPKDKPVQSEAEYDDNENPFGRSE